MRSSTRTLVGLTVLAIVIGGTVAAAYLVLRPSTTERDERIPELEYYTTDLAGVLSEADLYNIDGVCGIVNDNSSCEMAVVVVNTTEPYDINYFALRTFQYNEIGEEGRDNGILVVVATEDHAWRIEVGYGLEGILTDVRVNDLAQEYLVPSMDQGYIGDGLFDLTYAIGEILETEYSGDRSPGKTYPISFIPLTWGDLAWMAVIYIVLVVVTKGLALRPLIFLLSMFGGGKAGFGGGRSGGGGASGGR